MLGSNTVKFRTKDITTSSKRSFARAEVKARLEGYWKHDLYAPVKVWDAQKFNDLFYGYLSQEEFDVFADHSYVTDKTVKRLINTVYNSDKQQLKELEKCLFGGGKKWTEEYENLVVNEGLNDILDVYLSGGTQDTTWFVGLLAASPTPLAAWTATEVGAADFVAYSESTLQAFTDGGVSSQSVSNSASPATFSINTNSSSIGGAYLIGTNAKATPAGTVYSAGAFSGGNKAADSGDSLEVTCTFTSADDGV